MNSACAKGNRETDRRRDVPIDGLIAGKAPACILGLLPAHLVRRSWSMHEAGLLTRGSNVRSAFPAFASGIGKNLPLTVARAVPELVCLADRTGFPFHPRKAEPHAAATLSAKEPRRNREWRLRERTAPTQKDTRRIGGCKLGNTTMLWGEISRIGPKSGNRFSVRCSIKCFDRPLCIRTNARRSNASSARNSARAVSRNRTPRDPSG